MRIRGVELALHPSPDYVSDEIRRSGDFFEADILDQVVERFYGGTIVDAGAHIGNHTAFFGRFTPAIVLAFEPVLISLELLLLNVRPFPLVQVHPVALSDRERLLRMRVDDGNLGHSRVAPDGDLEVPAIALDSLALEGVTLLKVDVEGHERDVLAGAQETIMRCRPLVLIEDWTGEGYGDLLPRYELAAEWETLHQTFLFAPMP